MDFNDIYDKFNSEFLTAIKQAKTDAEKSAVENHFKETRKNIAKMLFN